MSGRIWIILALAIVPSSSPLRPGEGGGGSISIRWEVDPSGTTSGVSVVGLSPEVLKLVEGPAWADRRATLFPVAIETGESKDADRPGMLGSYRVEGETLRFTPRYPFDRGRTYSATFRPLRIPGGSGPDLRSSRLVPKLVRPATVVTRVTPSGDIVPENLLKFYLHFSSAMSRGEVYERVRLLKADGSAVDLPFLRLAEELWDPTGTRLTLLIDPGRIKKGLKPREEAGPVLEAGHAYTLVIDKGWPDAEGDPLASEFRKSFRATVADEVQPDPKTWKGHPPTVSTRGRLSVSFPEALDRALIESALTLVDRRGNEVAGRAEVGTGETSWAFLPDEPWHDGDYTLLIDADLEDLAGNSILRPFEVDIQRDTPIRPEAKVIRLPITIRPAGP